MKNDLVGQTWASVKKNPIGAIGGGLTSFFIMQKITGKYWISIPFAVAGALIGSAVQQKISSPKNKSQS